MARCQFSNILCLQIHPSVAEGGAFALHFEHPTKADGLGGWMNRKEDAERLAAAEVPRPFCKIRVSGLRLGGTKHQPAGANRVPMHAIPD